VRAPAQLVYQVARDFDLGSLPLVRAIFWLREKFMGARPAERAGPTGLYAQMKSIGWGILAEEPGRLLMAGASCQPWKADVTFTPIPAEEFAGYAEPDRMKIAWTIEVEALGPDRTRCTTETRAVATDPAARAKFLRYWRRIVIGVVAIRWLLLRGVRRGAERRWRKQLGARSWEMGETGGRGGKSGRG
jgi:hypothetical protein